MSEKFDLIYVQCTGCGSRYGYYGKNPLYCSTDCRYITKEKQGKGVAWRDLTNATFKSAKRKKESKEKKSCQE